MQPPPMMTISAVVGIMFVSVRENPCGRDCTRNQGGMQCNLRDDISLPANAIGCELRSQAKQRRNSLPANTIGCELRSQAKQSWNSLARMVVEEVAGRAGDASPWGVVPTDNGCGKTAAMMLPTRVKGQCN